MIALATVNEMDEGQFVAAFGDVAEHSPWVAERACALRPFADAGAMITAFQDVVKKASEEDRLDLLRAHPDLAGRTAISGEIGRDSASEQAGAGLDSLTADEFARFTEFNNAYRARFGFPFILAVRGATKHDILAAFAARIESDRRTEFERAIEQVCRIIRFRIEDRLETTWDQRVSTPSGATTGFFERK